MSKDKGIVTMPGTCLDKIFCTCGAEMEMNHNSIVDWSDLGCFWLECPVCKCQSAPAITEEETILYWNNFKDIFGQNERGCKDVDSK